MNKSSGTLRILVRTGVTVSNREASNAFLSCLAYVLGGLIFSSMAIIPVVAGSSEVAANSPLVFVVFVAMFDYLNTQVFLLRTTLTDKSTLSLFPLSPARSAGYRFVLMLLEKRILFYAVPMLVVFAALLLREEPGEAMMVVFLYVSLYLVISELLFGILPIFRTLAERYSPRTAMQIAIIPIVFFLFIPGVFHVRHEMVLRIPVVSQFVKGFKYTVASGFVPAAAEVGELLSISLVLGAAMTAAGLLLQRIGPALALPLAGASRRKTGKKASSTRYSSKDDAKGEEEEYETEKSQEELGEIGSRVFRRLIFLDWKIRQKEERFLLLIIAAPFAALLLAQSVTPALHSPMASVILPTFILTQIAGIPYIDNIFTRRGLRLKNVSILPVKPEIFVRMKFLSGWIPIVLASFFTTLILGLRWHISYYQGIQATIYSLFIPSVLIFITNTFTLAFYRISRHPFIYASIALIIESVMTTAYVLLMTFDFLAGLMFVLVLLSLIYFRWMPGWGRKLSLEFQNLLEEWR